MGKAQSVFMVQDETSPAIFHKKIMGLSEILSNSLSRFVKVSKNCCGMLYILPDGKKMLFIYDDKRRRVQRTIFKEDAPLLVYLSEIIEEDTKKIRRKSIFWRLDYRYHTHWWRYFKKRGYCKKEEN